MKKRVAAYCRVATEAQLGLEAQRERLKSYIAEHPDWELVKNYCDIGSASDMSRRDGLTQLLLDAKNNEFSVLAVHSPSRLARGVKQFRELEADLERSGVEIRYSNI